MSDVAWTAAADVPVPEGVARLLSTVPEWNIEAARTRHFYEKVGFLPVEETGIWGEGTPCLFMVKPI